MKFHSKAAESALTMVEAMITVGLVSVVSAVALLVGANFKGNIEQAKFEQDVQSVNDAAKIFLANGGHFDGLSNPQDILDRMKTAQAASKQKQFIGMTGATIDRRLAALPAEEDYDGPTAYWDSNVNRFVIGQGEGIGVALFELDAALAEVDYGEFERDPSAFDYDEDPGWIWKYEEATPDLAEGPTIMPTGETPDAPPPALPVPLFTPNIVLSSKVFNDSTPEITIRIDNPNPGGSSEIFYSLVPTDGSFGPPSSWAPYVGPLVALSGDYPDGFKIIAYAKSIDSGFLDSDTRSDATTSEFFGTPAIGNVLFVVDASGSMSRPFGSTTRFEATKAELITAIEGLPGNIKFNVALFDGGVHWTDGTYRLHPSNQNFKSQLISKVRGLDQGRGTNYSAALSLPPKFKPVPDQVILLSDGEPNDNGFLDDLAVLVSLGIQVDTVGLNSSGNGREVLQLIADETGGKTTLVK